MIGYGEVGENKPILVADILGSEIPLLLIV